MRNKITLTFKYVLIVAVFILFVPAVVLAEEEGPNILFILDSSGSMMNPLGDVESRIEAAKRVLSDLVAGLPAETNVGLEVYGHREKTGCDDIEIVVPVGMLDVDVIKQRINSLEALGNTPIASALERGADEIQGLKGIRTIVLISDGEETCKGDPISAAEQIRKRLGVDVIIQVIGLAVDDNAKQQLAGIAQAGGGTYYSADNAEQLKDSLVQIKKEVVKKEPPKDIFAEEFDKPFLSEEWEIINEDPDNMVIEDGYLTVLLQPGWPSEGKTHNILLYSGDLPNNYEVIARFKAHIEDFPSLGSPASQRVGLVLYTSKDNFIEMTTAAEGFAGYKSNEIKAASGKYKKGKWSSVSSSIITTIGSNQWTYKGEFEFKFQKNGHKYIGSFKNAKGKWIKSGEFADLKGKYKPGIMAYRAPKTDETMAEFDSFKIKELE
ncbi:MAG: VWA domain-containing protein [Candidatus Scalindua sp.]